MIGRKHYLIAGSILALAFLLQPFALLFVQINLLPSLVPLLTGKNMDGSPAVNIVGKQISTENLKIRGNTDAEIVLVEFSDIECPFCARFHSAPKNLVNKNTKVAWAWRHFPLPSHPNATPAAVASECVNKLAGTTKFWQFIDVLIANQQKLSEGLYVSEAAKLGVDAASFKTCIKDSKVEELVNRDLREGISLGVNGTPNTFITQNKNGKLIILESVSGTVSEQVLDRIVSKYVK